MSKKKDTVSVIVRPLRPLVARLDALARQYKRESANQLIVEIAEMYTDMWVELEKARLDMYKLQWEHMRKTLTLPLHSAEAQAEQDKPQAHGKKGRR
jgi:hypothetical protein